MKKMLVIGRYNVGLSIFGSRIPKPGETVLGERFEMGPGDKGSNPAIAEGIMARITEVHLENLRRVLACAGDRIDMVYTYDDLAHQHGLIIDPDLWRRTVGRFQKRLFALARSHDKPLMVHCCGAVRPLLGELLDIGLNVLAPVQTSADGMIPVELKREFGRDLTFHGGVDIQQLLPRETPAVIQRETAKLCLTLGQGGGHILAPAHHIQPDTPIENVLSMYTGPKTKGSL